MGRKMFGVGALALVVAVLVGGAAIVNANPLPAPYEPEVPYVPEPPDAFPPEKEFYVQALQGFAMERDSLSAEPVALVRMSYNGKERAYLFIGEQEYRLTEEGSKWIRGGYVASYSISGLDERLLLYSQDSYYSNAFGWLGERMVVFQPGNSYYPMPVYDEKPAGGIVNQTLEKPMPVLPLVPVAKQAD